MKRMKKSAMKMAVLSAGGLCLLVLVALLGFAQNAAAQATFSMADAGADEGDAITFTVTLTSALQESDFPRLMPMYIDGTAVSTGAMVDYMKNTGTIDFTGAGMGDTRMFMVMTTEDTVVEANETFTVNLVRIGVVGTNPPVATATGTIRNDDELAVTIEDASATEGDAITFTATLNGAVSGGLMVMPTYTDVTAVAGTDYTQNTDAITFVGTAGETQTFMVMTTNDSIDENDETFTVGLTVMGSPSLTPDVTDTATGTIMDNDDPPVPAVTIEDASATEGNTITFTVTLSEAVAGGFMVTPSYTDVTATTGTDYTQNTAAIAFTGTADETQTFTVATTDDTMDENDETFTVGLTVSGASTTVTATDTATGTIMDNDDPPPAVVTIEDASATEGNAITFTVTLSGAVAGGFMVTPTYAHTAPTTDADYTQNTAAIAFTGTDGETQTFTVATTDDTMDENDERFTVGLTVSGASTTVTATDTATGTIRDNDDPPPPPTPAPDPTPPVARTADDGYTIGDPAAAKLIPYFETGVNRATIIGIRNLSPPETVTIDARDLVDMRQGELQDARNADPDSGNYLDDINAAEMMLMMAEEAANYSESLFVDVTVYDAAGMMIREATLCLREREFGHVVLQGPTAPARDPLLKSVVLSVDDGTIPAVGYVTVEVGEKYTSCRPPADPPGNLAEVDGGDDGQDSKFAAWAIIQDVGAGFFGTEVPTPTITLDADAEVDCYNDDNNFDTVACGLIPERANNARTSATDDTPNPATATPRTTASARYDTRDDSAIYVWLARDDMSTLASQARTLDIVVECEDGTVLADANIDGVPLPIAVPARGHLTVIDPAAGIVGDHTARCEGGTRGTLKIEMPDGSQAGMVFTHITQFGDSFRINFPGYSSISPATCNEVAAADDTLTAADACE